MPRRFRKVHKAPLRWFRGKAGGGAASRPVPAQKTKYRRTINAAVGRPGVIGGSSINFNQAVPFANRRRFAMKYVEEITLTSGAAGVIGTTATFYLNSIYSPKSSGGHQPYGHDTLAGIYNFYKVQWVKIELLFTQTTDNYNRPCVQIRNSSDTGSISGLQPYVVAERPGARIYAMTIDSGTSEVKEALGVSPAEIDGISPAQFNADDARYLATFGANPAAIPKLEIGLGNTAATSGATCQCIVTLTYYGYASGRLQLAVS